MRGGEKRGKKKIEESRWRRNMMRKILQKSSVGLVRVMVWKKEQFMD